MSGDRGPGVWAVSRRFLGRARPHLPRIALTVFVVLCASGAKASQAALIGPVIDRFSGKPAVAAPEAGERTFASELRKVFRPQEWDLRIVAVLALGLSGLMFVFGCLRDYLTNWLTNRMVVDLRNDLAEHLAYLPLRFHYDRKSGDLVSRVTNDVAVTESATNFLFDDGIVHPIMILCAGALAFWTHWGMALGAVVLFPVYALLLARLARRMRKARRESLESLGDMTGTMVQTFGGIKVVKAFNTEAQQVAEFKRHNEGFFRRYMSALGRKAVGENLNQLFMGFAVALLLAGGWTMFEPGSFRAGQLATFALAVAMINSSVREMSKSYTRLVEASAGAERLFELLDQPRETEHDRGRELSRIESLELRGVGFAYESAPVLRDVSLRAQPGEVIAVAGRSGAGKTTLCDLLCRFYDPQEGAVRVNGVDLRELRRSSLLSRTAVVTQETFLFDTTAGENVRYGRRDATDAEVREAARAAHIDDVLSGLEKGYATLVGERGVKLSGGQRQRVAIARAILRDPDLLILDEATSALDSESEQAVQAALANLLRSSHRITFVIAHRLSTIQHADRIIVLDQGRIVEEGRHEELLEKGGVYASLYRLPYGEELPTPKPQ